MNEAAQMTEQDTDAAEWQAIEQAAKFYGYSQTTGAMLHYEPITGGARPKHSDKPHPDSYGADLPMRGQRIQGMGVYIPVATKADKQTLAKRSPLRVRLYDAPASTSYTSNILKKRRTLEQSAAQINIVFVS